MVNYWTGIERFEGAFTSSHPLAYAMLFFSFVYCLLNRIHKLEGKLSRFGLSFFHLLAIYCLYKSYTRTAMVGFIIFWSIYLWGTNKKRFFLAIMACVLITILSYQKIEVIFWQIGKHGQTEIDLDAASSGRLTIWHHNLQVFLDSDISEQLLGLGLGSETRRGIASEKDVWQPHNNYLNLLMSLGIIGLFSYLILIANLLWDIYTCGLDKSEKFLFAAIFISTGAMNFLSNAVIFRPELSQYFWLFMGFFYFSKDCAEADQLSSTESLSRSSYTHI